MPKQSASSEVNLSALKSSKGVCLLKFGRMGDAREKVFYLTGDNRILYYYSQIISHKFGRRVDIDFRKVIKIQRGQTTFPFQRMTHLYGLSEQKSLSIMYVGRDGTETSLDVTCPSKEVFKMMYDACRSLMADAQEELRHYYTDKKYVDRLWMMADSSNNGSLSREEVLGLCKHMDLGVNPAKIEQLFVKVDADSSGHLQRTEFFKFIHILLNRLELETLWSMIIRGEAIRSVFTEPVRVMKVDPADKKHSISVSHFMRFWSETQSEALTEESAMNYLARVVKEFIAPGDEIEVSYLMWVTLISSSSNDIFSPNHMADYPDFNRGKFDGSINAPMGAATGPMRITVNIMSAHQLPVIASDTAGYSHDPYCVVSIKGGVESPEKQTSVVYANGYNPIFNEVFTFDVVKPDVSVLQLVLLDEDVGDDQILGYSTVPVTAIRPGIRFMPLFDETGSNGGDYEYSFICVRVAVELL